MLNGVAQLLRQGDKGVPLSLVTDADVFATIHSMSWLRGFDTVKITKRPR